MNINIPAALPCASPRRRSSCFLARTISLRERWPAHDDDDDDNDDDDDENVEKGEEEDDDDGAEVPEVRDNCGGGASVLSLRTRRVRCACGN